MPSNAVFISQAYVNLKFEYLDVCFALYNESEPVGFTKVVYVPKGAEPYGFSEDTYMIDALMIDALMIDAKHQGKGYGSEAFRQVLRFIETRPFGESNIITLACHDNNTFAVGICEESSFHETDQFVNREKKLRIYSKTIRLAQA